MSIGYRLILSEGVRIKQEPHDDADPPGKISGRAAHAPWWKSPDICVSDEKAVLPGPDEEVVLPGPVGSTMRLPTSCFRCSLTFSRRDGKFIYKHYCHHFRDILLGKAAFSVSGAGTFWPEPV